MKVKYVGPFDAAFVPTGPYEGVDVPRGSVHDFPDGLALGLLEQPSNWQPVEDAPATEPEPASDAPATKKKGG